MRSNKNKMLKSFKYQKIIYICLPVHNGLYIKEKEQTKPN